MTTDDSAPVGRRHAGRRYLLARPRASVDAVKHLVGGLVTGALALAALIWVVVVALACVVGVGLVLAPSVPRVVRAVGKRERARLSRWGLEIIEPEPLPATLRGALGESAVRREFGWLALHATFGSAVGLIGLTLPLYGVQDVTFPLWWRLVSAENGGPGLPLWPVNTLSDAVWVAN
jgi:hypothetical protein